MLGVKLSYERADLIVIVFHFHSVKDEGTNKASPVKSKIDSSAETRSADVTTVNATSVHELVEDNAKQRLGVIAY